MAHKQIKIKKSSNTITGLVMSLLIVMFIFTGSYLFLIKNVSESGGTVDDKYNQSYTQLQESQQELDSNSRQIRDNLANITEAESNFQVAWNGLKGLGNALKLPVLFLSTTQSTFTSLTGFLSIIPGWVTTLAGIAIMAFVIFLVLKILKGEPNM